MTTDSTLRIRWSLAAGFGGLAKGEAHLDPDDIYLTILNRIGDEGDFFVLHDSAKRCMQFYALGDGTYDVEILRPDLGGALVSRLDSDGLNDAFRRMPLSFDDAGIESMEIRGLRFERWSR